MFKLQLLLANRLYNIKYEDNLKIKKIMINILKN